MLPSLKSACCTFHSTFIREPEPRLCCCSVQSFMQNNKLTECYRVSELKDNKMLERVTLKYGLQANALIMNQPDFSSCRRKRRSGPLKMSPAVSFYSLHPRSSQIVYAAVHHTDLSLEMWRLEHQRGAQWGQFELKNFRQKLRKSRCLPHLWVAFS